MTSRVRVPSSNWRKLQAQIENESTGESATIKTKRKAKSTVVKKTVKKVKKDAPVVHLDEKSMSLAIAAQVSETMDKANASEVSGTEQRIANAVEDGLGEVVDIPGESTDQKILRLLDDSHMSSDKKEKGGKYLAMDCEMVGVGEEGVESALARVSIVNFYGHVLLDRYVKPQERVTDFRTHVSGITPYHLKEAHEFKAAQKEVHDLIKDKVIVGHSIHNDLKALILDHPKHLIRDTSVYHVYRKFSKGKTPGLKKLAQQIFNIKIQEGKHSSVSSI
ncbi:3'-5' exonuclease, variant 3 [Basidiobolus ranarum]|uniref:RNA exonuclease 4 n=1 Tax=Basidiobolus ranarum TaxID=34480 RepID=A0ABR2WZL7_9FUNG